MMGFTADVTKGCCIVSTSHEEGTVSMSYHSRLSEHITSCVIHRNTLAGMSIAETVSPQYHFIYPIEVFLLLLTLPSIAMCVPKGMELCKVDSYISESNDI